MQKMAPSKSEGDKSRCEEQNVGSDHDQKQILPFCFVKIWPKDAEPICTIQEAVKLFEEMDQQHLQISEMIREKVFDRERTISTLKELKDYYSYRFKLRMDQKKGMLNQLYLALDNLSIANKAHRGRAINSCSTKVEVDNHKLNFMMLHKSKSLAEEKQLLRDMNINQHIKPASSTSIQLSQLQRQFNHPLENYNQKNSDRLLREIKQFQATKKNSQSLRKSMRNQTKITGDELMEMRKKRCALETKIKHAEKELAAINEEIWSCQKHLKDRHNKKEASLFILQKARFEEDYWVLKLCNLECESMHFHTIYSEKSSSR